MGHYIIFPQKDATIYSKFPEINTGLDEILEITKEISSSFYFNRGIWKSTSYYNRFDYVQSASSGIYYYAVAENVGDIPGVSPHWKTYNKYLDSIENSRVLIQFDITSIPNNITQSADVVYLNLFTCIAKNVPIEYNIEVCPLSSSWQMGTGFFTEKDSEDGVCWTRRTQADDWNSTGSDYYITPTASQTFDYDSNDVRVDIKNIFSQWTGSAIPNNGVLIKRPDSQENDDISYGSISFYSMDTHTVYLPTLEILYNDYSYSTSSFYPVNASGSVTASLISGSIDVVPMNLRTSYLYNTTNRFKILVKESYQVKTFYERLIPTEIKYLHSGSLFYSIRDAYSNRIIIPFSQYTGISLNSEGHYFDLSTSGLMPERFYKIIFKYIYNSVDTYFDNNYIFKLVK